MYFRRNSVLALEYFAIIAMLGVGTIVLKGEIWPHKSKDQKILRLPDIIKLGKGPWPL